MKTKHCFLLPFILLSLGGFTACVNIDHTLGVDFAPDDAVMKMRVYQDTTIALYTAALDSIITSSHSSNASYGLFGSVNHDLFGRVTAGSVFQVHPLEYETDFGNSPVLTSVRLRLTIEEDAQLSEEQKGILQNIRVYQVTKKMDVTSPYYNNSLKPDEYIHTAISQAGVIYNGGDTLSIPLTPEFGNFLLGFTADDMFNDSTFHEKLQGFYITTDPLPANVKGGRINRCAYTTASTYSIASFLELTYKHEGTDSTLFFWVGQGVDVCFNTITHESWNTLANYSNVAPTPPEPTVYIEGLAGVKPFIDFTEVKTKIESWTASQGKSIGQLAVANAQLSVGVDIQNPTNLDTYPGIIFLGKKYLSDDDYTSYTPLNDIQYADITSTNLNRSLLHYSMDITSYMNRFLQGKDTTSQLFLLPILIETDDYYGTSYFLFDNQTYSYGKLSGVGSARPVKFKMTYTFLE